MTDVTSITWSTLDGVRSVALGDASILILESVTDEIINTVKKRLMEYCYGRVTANEDPSYYSFELTIEEFFHLYETKSDKVKLGLAGELLVHLLASYGHETLTTACVYFNKEERNLKKGFDLTFLDLEDEGIWYGEVKSGQVNEFQTADSKVRDLMTTAELGLHAMFTSDVRKKRWDAAVADADHALSGPKAKSVKELLRTDFKTIHKGGVAKVRALLCGVVMHPIDMSTIDASTGSDLHLKISERGRFDQVRLLLVQQSAVEALIEALRSSSRIGIS